LDNLGSEKCEGTKDTIYIYINPTPQINVSLARDSICYSEGATFTLGTPNTSVIGTMKYNLTVTYTADSVTNVIANGVYDNFTTLDQSNIENISSQIQVVTYTFTPFIENYSGSAVCAKGVPVTINLTVVPEVKFTRVDRTYIGGKNIRCYGQSTGESRLTDVRGGLYTSPYIYTWRNSVGDTIDRDNRATGLFANVSYSVSLKDKIGCFKTETFVLTQPDSVYVILDTIKNVGCNNEPGYIEITPVGGIPGYMYFWADLQRGDSYTTQDIYNLEYGPYRLTVRDANLCAKIYYYTLVENKINLNNYGRLPDYPGKKYDISCKGKNNAEIYYKYDSHIISYEWFGPNGFYSTLRHITNLYAGDYRVKLTNDNGCSEETILTVTEPDSISFDYTLPLYNPDFNVQCHNGSDGRIHLNNIKGGHGNYSYTWTALNGSGIVQGDSVQNSLTLGRYSVLVQDNILLGLVDTSFCSATDTFILSKEPSVLTVTPTVSNFNGVEVRCNGTNTGSVTLDVSGGYGTYTYNWAGTGSGIIQGQKDQPTLGEGNYTVTVTYNGVCDNIYNYSLRDTTPIILQNTLVKDVDCNGGSDGSISVQPNGGIPNYTYSWIASNGGVVLNPANEDQNNLVPGDYTLIVTDRNSCTDTFAFRINEPDSINVAFEVVPINCSNGTNGTVIAHVTGGTRDYTYDWNSSSGDLPGNDSIQTGLTTGIYTLFIVDRNNCVPYTNPHTVLLPAPNALKIIPQISFKYNGSAISCYGNADAEVTLVPVGGTPPYNFIWPRTGDTARWVNNLGADTFSVHVTDNYGCTGDTSFRIDAPGKLRADFDVINNLCWYENRGQIRVIPQGGTPVYSYNWGDGNSSAVRTNLRSGDYTLNLRDANNCSFDTSINIPQLDSIRVFQTITQPYCPDALDGQIVINASGGSGNLIYTINGVYSNIITQAKPDIYYYSVRDGNGCEFRDTIYLTAQFSACLSIVNAFSPDGNGVNEFWEIMAVKDDPNYLVPLKDKYENAIVEIFNRWGELVFRSKPGYPEPWDGTYKGRPLPLDSYYYVIDPKNGSKPMAGIVTIVK
jgi:gliding motility-associated-like protein